MAKSWKNNKNKIKFVFNVLNFIHEQQIINSVVIVAGAVKLLNLNTKWVCVCLWMQSANNGWWFDILFMFYFYYSRPLNNISY